MKPSARTRERDKSLPPPIPPELPTSTLLKIDQVLLYVPVSRAQWFRGVKEGIFPQPRRMGRLTFWHSRDIRYLIEHGFTLPKRAKRKAVTH